MIEIPGSLIDRLKTRSAVLVAGLRCSEFVRLPAWDELAERLVGWLEEEDARSHVRALMAAGRRTAAFAAMRARLPDEVVIEVLRDAYPPQKEAPSSVARLGRIPWRGVISTAYDNLWEVALRADKRQATRVFVPGDVADLEQHRGRFLLQLFGATSVPASVCLVPSELRQKEDHAGLASFLSALAHKRSLVFVGFQPRDPDLEFLAQRLMGADADPAQHFLLYAGEPGLDAESTGAELGLTAVPCQGSVDQIFRALTDAWSAVEATARPSEDDLDGWLESLSRDPGDEETRAALARIEKKLRQGGMWARVVESLLGRLEHMDAAADQVVALNEVGRIYAEELDRDDHAIESFQHVLTVQSENATALGALAKLYSKHERWTELTPVLTVLSTAASDRARKVDLLLQLAGIQEGRLGEEDAALCTFEGIAELDPGSREATEALERLYRKRQRWHDLARVLDRKAKAAKDPGEAAKIRRERADLLADRVGDVEASVTTLEGVLAHDPGNREALRSLESLYGKQGRIEDSLRILDRLCDVAESDSERLSYLRRLAAGWESQPDGFDRAADALKQVLQIQRGDRDAFAALRRLYREAKRWSALADTLARQIEARPDDDREERRELQASLGKIYEEELRDLARAAEAFAAAEELGDNRESTLEAVARLCEQQEQWRPCVDALDRWARVAKDGATRARVFHRAATILAEELEDRAGAEDRYVKALEADPAHVPTLAGLATLYQAQGDYLRAAKFLLEAEQHTQNRLEKVRLLFQAGVLFADQVADEGRATELFARVLAMDPEHLQAGERAVALYTKREAWASLEPVLEMVARKADKGNVALAAEIQGRLGLTAQKLGNRDKALRNYENAYRLAPDALPVIAGFADLRMVREEWREAATLYQKILAQHRAALPEDEVVDVYMRLGRCEA
ncbi:MAG TPA: SIR2 family protein, partial [Polyangia bacterium]|nr:SIR2 family protein [Polyangia bacterium]